MADAIADIGARPDLVQTLRNAAQAPQAPLAGALSSLRAPPPGPAPATPQLFEPLSLRAAAVPAAVAPETPGFPVSVASQDFTALIEGAGRDQATADRVAGAFLDASALL